MSRADYAHWNEEADLVWWAEEGRHAESDAENDRDTALLEQQEWWDDLDACVECDGGGKVEDLVCEHCGGDGIEP